MPNYDYRAARDRIFGVRRENDKIVGYETSPANMQERLLLLALVEFAPNIEPSTMALSHMLGTSERQVRRLLRSAETKGLLRVEQRVGHRSRYVLADPGLLVPPDGESPRTISPPTPDGQSSPPRTISPPKQTTKADKKADKRSASADASGSPARSSRKKKTDSERSQEERNAYCEIKDLYFQVYERCTGQKPPFGSREGKAIWTLYDAVGLETGSAILSNAFGDEWGKRRSILSVVADPAKFIGSAPRKNGQTPKQPNHGAFDASRFEV